MDRGHRVTFVVILFLAGSSLVTGGWYWLSATGPETAFDPGQLSREERARVACGPIALAMCGQLSGVFFEPSDVIATCALTIKGASADELVRVANSLGLSAETVNFTWEQLSAHSAPLILHVNGTHYVTADPRHPRDASPEGEDSVRVYDPGGAATWWSRKHLLSRWDGVALVVDVPQAGGQHKAGLHAETWWTDIGPRDCESVAEFSVPVRSGYPDNATIEIVHKSCDCTTAEFDVHELKPGDTATLAASLDLTTKRGPFRERVRFTSVSGSTTDLWCLTLAGTAIGKVEFSASELALGDLRPAETKPASIVVRDPGDVSLDLESATVVLEEGSAVAARHVKFTRVTPQLETKHRRQHLIIKEHDWLVSFDAVVVNSEFSGKVVGELIVTGTYNEHDEKQDIELTCPIMGWIR